MQVNFLAADINDLGLDQFLEEHRAYGIGYGLFAVAYFVAAMSIARGAPNPQGRGLNAARGRGGGARGRGRGAGAAVRKMLFGRSDSCMRRSASEGRSPGR